MKKGKDTRVVGIASVVVLLLLVSLALRPNGDSSLSFDDIEELRSVLRERVDRGAMSKPEAQVALARALAQQKKGTGKGKRSGRSEELPDMEKVQRSIDEALVSGKITEEEADEKLEWLKSNSEKGGK